MDKLKNIISPGHQKDDEVMYGTGKPTEIQNKGTVAGEGSHFGGPLPAPSQAPAQSEAQDAPAADPVASENTAGAPRMPGAFDDEVASSASVKSGTPGKAQQASPIGQAIGGEEFTPDAPSAIPPTSTREPRPAGSTEPGLATSNEPVLGTQNEPVFGGSTKPAPATRNEPLLGDSTEPVHSTKNEPVLSGSTGPVLDASSQPERVTRREPVSATSNEPGLGASTEPGPGISNKPVLGGSAEPVPATRKEPVLAAGNEPVLGSSRDPVQTTRKEPEPLARKEPILATINEPVHGTGSQPLLGTQNEPAHATSSEPQVGAGPLEQDTRQINEDQFATGVATGSSTGPLDSGTSTIPGGFAAGQIGTYPAGGQAPSKATHPTAGQIGTYHAGGQAPSKPTNPILRNSDLPPTRDDTFDHTPAVDRGTSTALDSGSKHAQPAPSGAIGLQDVAPAFRIHHAPPSTSTASNQDAAPGITGPQSQSGDTDQRSLDKDSISPPVSSAPIPASSTGERHPASAQDPGITNERKAAPLAGPAAALGVDQTEPRPQRDLESGKKASANDTKPDRVTEAALAGAAVGAGADHVVNKDDHSRGQEPSSPHASHPVTTDATSPKSYQAPVDYKGSIAKDEKAFVAPTERQTPPSPKEPRLEPTGAAVGTTAAKSQDRQDSGHVADPREDDAVGTIGATDTIPKDESKAAAVPSSSSKDVHDKHDDASEHNHERRNEALATGAAGAAGAAGAEGAKKATESNDKATGGVAGKERDAAPEAKSRGEDDKVHKAEDRTKHEDESQGKSPGLIHRLLHRHDDKEEKSGRRSGEEAVRDADTSKADSPSEREKERSSEKQSSLEQARTGDTVDQLGPGKTTHEAYSTNEGHNKLHKEPPTKVLEQLGLK